MITLILPSWCWLNQNTYFWLTRILLALTTSFQLVVIMAPPLGIPFTTDLLITIVTVKNPFLEWTFIFAGSLIFGRMCVVLKLFEKYCIECHKKYNSDQSPFVVTKIWLIGVYWSVYHFWSVLDDVWSLYGADIHGNIWKVFLNQLLQWIKFSIIHPYKICILNKSFKIVLPRFSRPCM